MGGSESVDNANATNAMDRSVAVDDATATEYAQSESISLDRSFSMDNAATAATETDSIANLGLTEERLISLAVTITITIAAFH